MYSSQESFFRNLWIKLCSPPPWKILGYKFFQRLDLKRNNTYIFLEIFQFLRWLISSLFNPTYFLKYKSIIPLDIFLKACVLNCFSLSEIKILLQLGFRSWSQLSEFNPKLLTLYRHQENRKDWPNQSQEVIDKLGNKVKILEITPERFKVPFLVNVKDDPLPNWWKESLISEGVIVKPIYGKGGEDVIRYWTRDSKLYSHNLFIKNDIKILDIDPAKCSPKLILDFWNLNRKKNGPPFAMPYILNDKKLPNTYPSIVVRVISERKLGDRKIFVKDAWIEYKMGNRSILQNNKGTKICYEKEKIKIQLTLKNYDSYLANHFKKSINGSILMHKKLDNIDRIAWDWIPSDKGPKLLEGNSCFGLFTSEIFNKIDKRNL